MANLNGVCQGRQYERVATVLISAQIGQHVYSDIGVKGVISGKQTR